MFIIRRLAEVCVIGALVWGATVSPAQAASSFTIPEAKLLDGEFAGKAFGLAAVARTDAPGPAVDFAFSGLTASATGLKDDYLVDTVYGQILPSHANGDFSNFSGYGLVVENLDSDPVEVSLFINTGFTGPSGVPSNDPTNDTFWQSSWVEIAGGASRSLLLDFASAIPWSISDNVFPHTQGTNGVATAINAVDRAELSSIGFQVALVGSNSDATVRVSPVPLPSGAAMGLSTLLLMAGGGMLARRRRLNVRARKDV